MDLRRGVHHRVGTTIDIARYRAHQDCRTLVCFVYDPLGRIGNPAGIERDLSGTRDGLTVKVFIAPRS